MMSAEFIMEMAWKSTVLAATVLVLLALMRRHDPSHRAAVGSFGLTLLLVLPMVALAVAALPVPGIDLPAPGPALTAVPVMMDQGPIPAPLALSESSSPAAGPAVTEALLLAAWAIGALFLLLRLAVGLLTL